MRALSKGLFKHGFHGFFFFFLCCIQNCFICRPSDSTVSEDAGIETRTVATSLAARRSNHPARSHPQTRLGLIHIRLGLIHNRLSLIHTRPGLIRTRQGLIHDSARSHQLLTCRAERPTSAAQSIIQPSQNCPRTIDAVLEKIPFISLFEYSYQ